MTRTNFLKIEIENLFDSREFKERRNWRQQLQNVNSKDKQELL